MASKVLVVGSPCGRFRDAFAKMAALQAKQNFALALITGDLFAADPSADADDVAALLAGSIAVPLPTYFTLGASPLPAKVAEHLGRDSSADQLCENLFFLGRKGALTTSEGLKLVYLGGMLDPNVANSSTTIAASADRFAPFYSATEAAALRGQNSADILLTSEWPAGSDNGSKVAVPAGKETGGGGTAGVGQLARALRPRYHFVPSSDVFYEREPYEVRREDDVTDVKITRLLGVAAYGNAAKAKALYAFSINPKDISPVAVPQNTTRCPYFGPQKRKQLQEPSENFFWGDHSHDAHGGRGGGHKRGRGGRGGHTQRPPPGPENCFFCLSYPQLEKHLIVSIGDEAYLTTAKGPLTSAATNPPTLPFSAHILIIPLAHAPTLRAVDDPAVRAASVAEMHRYRHAITAMLATRGCGAVTIEVARASGVHAHWQVVPVPRERLPDVVEVLAEEAAAAALPRFEDGAGTPEWEERHSGDDWFRVWISGDGGGGGGDVAVKDESAKEGEVKQEDEVMQDGGSEVKQEKDDKDKDKDKGESKPEEGKGEGEMVKGVPLAPDEYFDLQFGRRVCAHVLGASQGRVDWRRCVMPTKEEADDARSFKEAFKEFDFSLA